MTAGVSIRLASANTGLRTALLCEEDGTVAFLLLLFDNARQLSEELGDVSSAFN